MKLITLNTWGSRLGEPLFEFFEKYHTETDIFCLQEVWASRKNKSERLAKGQVVNQLQRTAKILSDFVPVFCPFETNVNNYDGSDPEDTSFGVAVFVRSNIELTGANECFVFRDRNTMVGTDAATLGRNIQHVGLKINNTDINIFNFHGLWNGNGKSDTPERIEQSKKVKEFMDKFSGPKILAGDFNLLPDTKSHAILKENMVDLVEKYKVTNTRSSYYEKQIRYADYILVSPDVDVKKFEVLPDEVSDHLALSLDFET